MLNICQIKIQHLCIHVFMTEKIKQEKKYPLKNSDDAMIIYLFSIKTKSTCIDYLRQHGIDKKKYVNSTKMTEWMLQWIWTIMYIMIFYKYTPCNVL